MSESSAMASFLQKQWAKLAMIVAGILLVGAGAWVAQSQNLLSRVLLEFNGERTEAIAEPLPQGKYRFRLVLDTATYSRTLTRSVKGAPEGAEEFIVPVVYDPADPYHFEPAGTVYGHAAISLVLFIAGMACVLTARRAAFAAERIQRLSRLKAEENRMLQQIREEKERKRKRSKHHSHSHRHATR